MRLTLGSKRAIRLRINNLARKSDWRTADASLTGVWMRLDA